MVCRALGNAAIAVVVGVDIVLQLVLLLCYVAPAGSLAAGTWHTAPACTLAPATSNPGPSMTTASAQDYGSSRRRITQEEYRQNIRCSSMLASGAPL